MHNNSLTADQVSGNVKNQDDAKTINTLAILSAGVSHELKNDISAIGICTELAERQLSNIKKRLTAANYLLNNLQLQINAVVAGDQSKEDFKLYSMAKNVAEALDQYYFQDNERSLITLDLDQDFNYIGNPSLTNHILHNLIRNSMRAIRSASKGAITIKLEPGIEFNKLTFIDTALGIPKEFLTKLFSLFESQNKSHGGTGVGLALCKQISKSYGGDIVCSSEKGKYTKFTLMLPCIT